MSKDAKEIYEFAGFRLDIREHVLERLEGEKVESIPEKAFQTLAHLVRNSGNLITKEELLSAVWPDTIVEENNLDKAIHVIRHVLGEKPGGQKYVETVRKHGYRFVATVKKLEIPPERVAGDPDNSEFPNKKNASIPIGEPTISTTTTESGAFVVSAKWSPAEVEESVQQNGHHVESPPDPDSDVQQVIESNQMGRSRWRLAIAVPLLLVLMAGLLAFAIYRSTDEAAVSNTSNLAVEPAGVRPGRGTNNDEAYRLYFQAMNLSEERGIQNVRKALEYLDRAVALDPNYALAWAGKAHLHRDIVGHSDTDQAEHYEKSMEAIRKALALDPNLSDAYSALCHNKTRYEYDFKGAETACKRALELEPDSAVAHKTYSNFLYTRGRFDESIVEIKKAMDLQPVSYRNLQIYGLALYFAQRYGEAEEQFKRLIELNPNHTYIYGRLIKVLEEQGKESEAFEYLIEMLTIQGENEKAQRFTAVYRRGGWRAVVIEQIKETETGNDPRNFQLACMNAKVGNKQKALEYLEKAYQERSFQMPMLKIEPQLNSLRNEPRFIDLVRRVEGN